MSIGGPGGSFSLAIATTDFAPGSVIRASNYGVGSTGPALSSITGTRAIWSIRSGREEVPRCRLSRPIP